MKIYVIDKINNAIHTFDHPKDMSIYMWGRACEQYIVVVSNKRGNCLIPLEMTQGDVKSIELIMKSFDMGRLL
jgi:hypothetical protein